MYISTHVASRLNACHIRHSLHHLHEMHVRIMSAAVLVVILRQEPQQLLNRIAFGCWLA